MKQEKKRFEPNKKNAYSKQLTLFTIMMCTDDLWINHWLKTKHIDRWILHVNGAKKKQRAHIDDGCLYWHESCQNIKPRNFSTEFVDCLRVHVVCVFGSHSHQKLRVQFGQAVCFMLLNRLWLSEYKQMTNINWPKNRRKKGGENNKRIKFYFFMLDSALFCVCTRSRYMLDIWWALPLVFALNSFVCHFSCSH